MYTAENKKLALIRIFQILYEHSDYDHPLTHASIAGILDLEYGIRIERKAIGRDISLLKEAGFEVITTKQGSYLAERPFDDSELRLIVDSIVASKEITPEYSKDLINRLSKLSNKYFKSKTNHIYSVNDLSKTDNRATFLNIDLIEDAIGKQLQIKYVYNKYGVDKKLHKSSVQSVSPYQMIFQNQRYYLMGYSEELKSMLFNRIDRMTDVKICEKKAIPIESIKGLSDLAEYNLLPSSLPYMFAEQFEHIDFIADEAIVDQIIDWFGKGITIEKSKDSKVHVKLKASSKAMEYWALQYLNHVEIISPLTLREKIIADIEEANKKYSKTNM